jgi:diguanylate cyclase (GGDEF)-like protein
MSSWALIPLLSCLTYIALCAVALQYIGQSNENRKANRLFVVYLAVAASWSFSAFMLHLNAFPKLSLFWNEILTVALVGSLITYYHFIRVYTNRVGNHFLTFGYVMLGILAFMSFNGWIVEFSYLKDGKLIHSLGNSIYFIGIFSLVYTIAVILLLIERYRTTTDPVDRNRTIYLMCGWSVLVVMTYTNLIPVLAPLPLDHLGNLFNAVIIAYAISRFQLLDIKFVVRRGLTYIVLTITLIAIYIGAVFLIYYVVSDQTILGTVAMATIIALLLTIMAKPLERLIQQSVDHVFYRDTYNYRQTLLHFGSRMGNILNIEELANEILPAISKALRITRAQLLFQEIGNGNFSVQYAYPEATVPETKGELGLNVDNPIVIWLERRNIPLAVDYINNIPELKGLWQAEKDQIARADVGLLCPIASRGKLIGILALGKKVKDNAFTHEDIELVRSMASQAGVIVENAQAYMRATQLANTDWLTGLYNHRSFHEHMEQEIARSSRFGAVFSLIMMDIDTFKSYNDACGHLAGDKALRTIGSVIQNTIRNADMAFRYGGEEFAVILPGTRLDDSLKVAERIRNSIETRTQNLILPITVSLGIASWPLDGVMREEIIGRADAALYLAKQSGRNRICISSEIRNQPSLISLELGNRTRALDTVYALAATVDARDHYTYGHSRKVSDLAMTIAGAIGLPANRVTSIQTAGLLHDIGKVGIPDSILKKKDPLTPTEWEYIKAHPRVGVEILRHVPDLSPCLPAILHHHERFDGSGYPSGLAGEAIPIEARILAVVDAYEAITSRRSYRSESAKTEVVQELRRCAGTQFDPQVVSVFCQLLEQSALKTITPAELRL